ncbi:hypothetical protein F935_01553 [Acinetobacter calcoaceticus ANC 3811]|uniref:Uncharacterized protein n=1 Tax=Acinetobacter calcoaceticus ANC 3811 TaxID=1217690 RepID=R8Y3J2_ACICA|nr:hypothetical protein [Acinetobacter calcoaceticus]EOQ63923.1 hypothetical protein F935_01553 [Acinetobacter calcoaceticus ANC 3811]
MRIFTEVVGGPNDGELVQVSGDSFNALDFAVLDILKNWEKMVSPKKSTELIEIQYRKTKATIIFNKKYYIREYFVCDYLDQNIALRKFNKYFNCVFRK